MLKFTLWPAFFAALLTGCASTDLPVPRREAVNAAAWMQKTLEYRLATAAVYQQATAQLDAAIASPGTAAAEQEGAIGMAALPPAVILDIDETVLDNSRYQAWRIKAGLDYSGESFRQWGLRAEAGPIEGAAKFLEAARAKGYRIVYITNRDCRAVRPAPCPEKDAIVANLARVGFPPTTSNDVLFRGEQEGWYEKDARRAEVAKTHRIVMMIGDDLRDLMPSRVVADLRKPGGEARHRTVLDKMGVRLFLLPNPVYGAWEEWLAAERCTQDDADCRLRNVRRKYDALEAVSMDAAR